MCCLGLFYGLWLWADFLFPKELISILSSLVHLAPHRDMPHFDPKTVLGSVSHLMRLKCDLSCIFFQDLIMTFLNFRGYFSRELTCFCRLPLNIYEL